MDIKGNAIRQVEGNLPSFSRKYKFSYATDNFYTPISEPKGWTDGFWPGELNLAYELTGERKFLDEAEAFVPLFFDRIVDHVAVDHHDMGFLYSPTCVAQYQFTGNKDAKRAALLAADHLCLRYHEIGRFIQCWGKIGDKDNYRCIIDCLMNIPLLFWAYDETGWEHYHDVAINHLHTAEETIIRKDGSVFQSYFLDPETGKPLRGAAHQAYSDSSTWARGESWAVYGLAIAYRYTHEAKAKELFFKTLDCFLTHLPDDSIPYWDFTFKEGSGEPRDSSALAVTICGMLEMAENLREEDKEIAFTLRAKAGTLFQELVKSCAVTDPALSNGQLLHSTYSRKSSYNTCKECGVDECTAWGDYYYLEAMLRLEKPGWKPYW